MKQEKYEVAYELCTARFESAQSDTPEHARSMVRLAQAQEAKRDRHGAIDSFTSVLEHYNTEHFQKLAGIGTSTLARIHYRLGRLYLNVGNKAAALEHATEAHRFWQHLVVSQNKPAAEPGADPLPMEEAAIVGIERQRTRRVQREPRPCVCAATAPCRVHMLGSGSQSALLLSLTVVRAQ